MPWMLLLYHRHGFCIFSLCLEGNGVLREDWLVSEHLVACLWYKEKTTLYIIHCSCVLFTRQGLDKTATPIIRSNSDRNVVSSPESTEFPTAPFASSIGSHSVTLRWNPANISGVKYIIQWKYDQLPGSWTYTEVCKAIFLSKQRYFVPQIIQISKISCLSYLQFQFPKFQSPMLKYCLQFSDRKGFKK